LEHIIWCYIVFIYQIEDNSMCYLRRLLRYVQRLPFCVAYLKKLAVTTVGNISRATSGPGDWTLHGGAWHLWVLCVYFALRHFGCLEFSGGSWIFENFFHSWLRLYSIRPNNAA